MRLLHVHVPGRGARLSRNLISVDWNGNGKSRTGLVPWSSSSSQLSSRAFLSMSFLQSSSWSADNCYYCHYILWFMVINSRLCLRIHVDTLYEGILDTRRYEGILGWQVFSNFFSVQHWKAGWSLGTRLLLAINGHFSKFLTSPANPHQREPILGEIP